MILETVAAAPGAPRADVFDDTCGRPLAENCRNSPAGRIRHTTRAYEGRNCAGLGPYSGRSPLAAGGRSEKLVPIPKFYASFCGAFGF